MHVIFSKNNLCITFSTGVNCEKREERELLPKTNVKAAGGVDMGSIISVGSTRGKRERRKRCTGGYLTICHF
jgi:hypothetical protein